MVCFKENYNYKRFQRGSNIFQGGGSKPIASVIFQGARTPYPPSGSAHAYDKSSVKPIPKDRFSHATVHFSFLERLVTPQNIVRYMILRYILSGICWIYRDFKWNKHALKRKLWEAKKAPILYIFILTCLFLLPAFSRALESTCCHHNSKWNIQRLLHYVVVLADRRIKE